MNDFRLGLRDAFRRAEFAQMRDADFQHNRDVRRHQRRQIGDFPNMVGTHFRYQKTSFGIYFERGQRQADFVIERSDRCNRRSHMRQQRLHKILGGGLADGTGDADHRKRSSQRATALDIVFGQQPQGQHRILHHNLRHIGVGDLMVDYRSNGTLSAHVRHVIVTVHTLSGNRYENRAFNNLP